MGLLDLPKRNRKGMVKDGLLDVEPEDEKQRPINKGKTTTRKMKKGISKQKPSPRDNS
jgi:hypothetical protein